MHCNNGSAHMFSLVLSKGFESSSLGMQRFALWGQGSNIAH
jgi:hypothetical protein